ncbi:ATP-binding protein [Deinococcus sp. Arct2-2]|uniref:AAA family ATPase n=1 Tax=Deinococcus sp. Arct2-2 TaxID=2568653 RepID=UPI0010A45BFA|nr:AAA family ATPase [Deinococcus sp. Arct2-2]THF71215.1 ATP-binding protein [Deinococcus sp. Arct2-2]
MIPTLLVISGLPASGKTQLGTQLAAHLRWPNVTKDDYKSILHEGLPDLPNAQSGPLSFRLMYHVAGITLAAGVNTVLETHFHRGLGEKNIQTVTQAHGAQLLQIFCHAPLDELARRHAARVASGLRPHIDHASLDHYNVPDYWCHTPLNLAAPLLRVDTTQPVDVAEVAAWVRSAPV